jgi:hypothetical protein
MLTMNFIPPRQSRRSGFGMIAYIFLLYSRRRNTDYASQRLAPAMPPPSNRV